MVKESHKASFGQPTEAEKAAIRDFVLSKGKSATSTMELVTLNGATFVPNVIYSADGKLHVVGESGHHLFATMENMQSGERKTIDLTKDSSNVDQIITLQKKGIYKVQIGSIQTIVVFQ